MSIDEMHRNDSSTLQVHHELHIYRKNLWRSLAIAAIFLVITVAGGYGLNWFWTGYPGNTLWDWMKLLLIPVGLVMATLYFSTARTWRKEWTYIFCGILFLLLVSTIGGYLLSWSWVGVKGNTLWNWFQLVFQPVGLAALSIFFGTKKAWRKEWTLTVGIVSCLLVLVIIGGYLFHWNWTGFKGNKLWDWIGMFLLPVALTVSAFSFKGYERAWAIVLSIVGLVLLVMMIGGYFLGWTWTGFQGNTLWDWLKLLLLPIALTVVEPLFETYQQEGISVALIAGVFMLAAVIGGYAFNWTWTGFHGTTLWNWFTILVLPFGLAAARLSFRSQHSPAPDPTANAQLASTVQPEVGSPLIPTNPYIPVNPYPSFNPYSSEEQTAKAPAILSTPTVLSSPRPAMRERKGLITITLAAILLILIGSGLGTAVFAHASGSNIGTTDTMGTLSFFSTYHHLNDDRVATNDGLKFKLQNMADPAMGNQYYGWLQNTKNASTMIVLGELNPTHGTLSFSYTDPQHRDLLASMNNLLITEEATNIVPNAPTSDKDLWRYTGSFPLDHAAKDINSYQDQIRQLLSSDPTLEGKGLHQGIDYWFLNNVNKLQNETKAAKNEQSVHQTRQDVANALYYLDGKCTSQDLTNVPTTLADENQELVHDTSISLLNCNKDSDFEGYITQMQNHLNKIAQNPAATSGQVNRAKQVSEDLDIFANRLKQVRNDARQLVMMDHDKLANAKTLRADMATQTSYLIDGHIDATTQTAEPSAQQLVNNIAALSNINIVVYKL